MELEIINQVLKAVLEHKEFGAVSGVALIGLFLLKYMKSDAKKSRGVREEVNDAVKNLDNTLKIVQTELQNQRKEIQQIRTQGDKKLTELLSKIENILSNQKEIKTTQKQIQNHQLKYHKEPH